MNKLEEYREANALICDSTVTNFTAGYSGFNEGFDAAIALELPVKFMNFYLRDFLPSVTFGDSLHLTKEEGQKIKNKVLKKGMTEEEEMKALYQYWIDNVYKPE